jgi:hypothetical protein
MIVIDVVEGGNVEDGERGGKEGGGGERGVKIKTPLRIHYHYIEEIALSGVKV